MRGLTRVLRSSAFQLTLRYMVVFGSSVALLLVFIYTATTGEMERQIKNSLNVQLADLSRKFIVDGVDEMTDAIAHLVAKESGNGALFMFISPNWKVLAGNVQQWPGGTKGEWVRIVLDEEKNPDGPYGKFLAINTSLPGGYRLLVGYTLKNVERVEQIIVQVFWLCMTLAVAMGALGGLWMARTIHRKLEGVNAICAQVMSGALDKRVPMSGSGDEFDHLAGNFNRMLTRINELIDGIRDISASVAHDLRTPLTRLRQRLERLENNLPSPGKTREEIRLSLTEIDTLVSTFNAILRIAQAESGARIDRFELFNASDTLHTLVELYAALAEEKSILIECDIAAGLTLKGDKHLLTQALANLLDNAVKYTPEGGHIDVTLTGDKQHMLFTIADNGPGIPAEFYGRVTDKFFRLEASRSSPGNGLGLSLAKAAVGLHQGELEFADNTPGLRVTVRIPLGKTA